jgi:hypothetical protein
MRAEVDPLMATASGTYAYRYALEAQQQDENYFYLPTSKWREGYRRGGR